MQRTLAIQKKEDKKLKNYCLNATAVNVLSSNKKIGIVYIMIIVMIIIVLIVIIIIVIITMIIIIMIIIIIFFIANYDLCV